MKTTEKAHQVLQEIVQLFETGDLPEAIARTTISMPDIPARKWSLGNRLLLWAAGTLDARTFLQWQAAGRHPCKGCKAIYILQPITYKLQREEEVPEDKEEVHLAGFKVKPVFRAEDTEGAPLDYQLEPSEPPPLWEVAEAWGVQVRYLPQTVEGVYGYHRSGGLRIEIGLHTHDTQVFCHELAHEAHSRVRGSLKGGQHWDQEIVAELTAATLCRLLGTQPNEGASYRYIRHYAESAGQDVGRACMAVLRDVEACLRLILEAAAQTRVAA